MSKIQSIYYDFINSGEYCDTQNAKNAYKQFEKTLKETTKDDKAAFNEIADACSVMHQKLNFKVLYMGSNM